MKDGFIKVAAGTPKIRVADIKYNCDSVLGLINEAIESKVKVLVLPELCLTGYTCGDLFKQDILLAGAENSLEQILSVTADSDLLFAIGLPVKFGFKLYNCAAVCSSGEILAIVPKTNLPDYGGFNESRWFTGGSITSQPFRFAGRETYFGNNIVFPCKEFPDLCIAVDISEDLWAPVPPSTALALNGATLILNPAASSETTAKAAFRREMVKSQSTRLICGYIYSDAGDGESSTDMVFAGHKLIAEFGEFIAESRFSIGLTISELDIERLAFERRRISTFPNADVDIVRRSFNLALEKTDLTRIINPTPFVPLESESQSERYEEILSISALGLKKRLEHTGIEKLVIGISGGLDSTLALLISAKALDLLGLERKNILAVTMPCFGTSTQTHANANLITSLIGATLKNVDINASVRQHFFDIGHDENNRNVIYENSQARERTQVLMDLANICGGMVIGTADMSELALGWTTYNGDHMSMYNVNSGIPKTLVRHLVNFCSKTGDIPKLSKVLKEILSTPISPELLPCEDGDISQKTEELVGPYELHDFFLYYFIRWGFQPKKILRLAECAFGGAYQREVIIKWLRVFIKRFFSHQFKRSCLPDGPKVGAVSLSPRGDLKMPSDAVSQLWLQQIENL